MNSNYGKTGASLNNLDFDLGLGSNRPKSLNEQKNKSNSSFSSYTYSSSSSFPQSKPANTTPSWQPGKPSWTHQTAPSQPGLTRTELGGPTSMVGDIFGKSWTSTTPGSSGSGSGSSAGIVNKNPNLFGDLVSSALGQNKNTSSNAPLKSAPPVKNSFSMGAVADSLPKTSYGSAKSGGGSWGSSNSTSAYGNSSMNNSLNVGGTSMRNVGSGGGGTGVGMSSNKDPFSSLANFGSKPMGGSGTSLNSSNKAGSGTSEDFAFGDFQNASKSSASASTFSYGSSNPIGSNSSSVPKINSFIPEKKTPVESSTTNADSFDMFFSSSSAAAAGGGSGATLNDGAGGQQFSGGDDWGMDSEFGGGHDGGNTTELEGLPPPPSGVSASTAKSKGLDNYKQGQYADAIKWLSWAEVLLEKAGDNAGTMEVLTCRASCYKEVGEYKKAVADCTKVLDQDGSNVSVLVQRALLYESMEKYRLGADDLRTVMKLNPGNRVARTTIHRLNKLAD